MIKKEGVNHIYFQGFLNNIITACATTCIKSQFGTVKLGYYKLGYNILTGIRKKLFHIFSPKSMLIA